MGAHSHGYLAKRRSVSAIGRLVSLLSSSRRIAVTLGPIHMTCLGPVVLGDDWRLN
jgi:hypothetical protein